MFRATAAQGRLPSPRSTRPWSPYPHEPPVDLTKRFRYNDAPAFRRLALLDGIRCIVSAQGVQPSLRATAIDVCLPMLLQGVDSADASIVKAATDIMLVSKGRQ